MYYYWKDKTRIGPVGAERILELYEAGAISDSTLLWNKRERWPEWRRFGDVRAEISKAAKVRWHSGYLRGLARNTMFFRAFLVAAIAVMGVQIFYTARSYGLLLEYLGESAAAGGDEFKISTVVAVRTLSFVNLMLAAVLALCIFRCYKWAKYAVMICYASSKIFRLLFSSENSYRWFFLQPFKMLRAIFAAASEMRARKPAFGDKFFSLLALRADVRICRDACNKRVYLEEFGFVHGETFVLLSRLHFVGGDMRRGSLDRLHIKGVFNGCRFAGKVGRAGEIFGAPPFPARR